MDLGCGGGFPGIPLAILFPNVHFHLVDSIGKKVRVAQEVATAIDLRNVEFSHARGEEIKEKYGVTSRCMPFEQEHIADTCVCCGKPAKKMVYWGKSY